MYKNKHLHINNLHGRRGKRYRGLLRSHHAVKGQDWENVLKTLRLGLLLR